MHGCCRWRRTPHSRGCRWPNSSTKHGRCGRCHTPNHRRARWSHTTNTWRRRRCHAPQCRCCRWSNAGSDHGSCRWRHTTCTWCCGRPHASTMHGRCRWCHTGAKHWRSWRPNTKGWHARRRWWRHATTRCRCGWRTDPCSGHGSRRHRNVTCWCLRQGHTQGHGRCGRRGEISGESIRRAQRRQITHRLRFNRLALELFFFLLLLPLPP
mmetsp:Transcript_147812/g.375622  ORF Transcript_147812/g.375622 Transcript_147812/m.375622 type:complete len:210 (+) Transcript_147812:1261-1890(+)